jgi:hypothetical protein
MTPNTKNSKQPTMILYPDGQITLIGKNEYGQLGYAHPFNYLLHPLTYAIQVALGR